MTFYDDIIAGADAESRTLVRVERSADRAVVTLDDPDKLNALSAGLTRQLKAALESLVADREIRTVVMTGAGAGFSAGGDLRLMDRSSEMLASAEGATDIWRRARGDRPRVRSTRPPRSASGATTSWTSPRELGSGDRLATACAGIQRSVQSLLVRR